MTPAQKKVIRTLNSYLAGQGFNTYDSRCELYKWAKSVNSLQSLHLEVFIETWWKKANGYKLCYISGPITGLEKEVYTQNFASAADIVSNFFEPIIPIFDAPLEWHEYMEIDLAILSLCEAIYMMKGWKDSKGAKVEHLKAKIKGMNIYYED